MAKGGGRGCSRSAVPRVGTARSPRVRGPVRLRLARRSPPPPPSAPRLPFAWAPAARRDGAESPVELRGMRGGGCKLVGVQSAGGGQGRGQGGNQPPAFGERGTTVAWGIPPGGGGGGGGAACQRERRRAIRCPALPNGGGGRPPPENTSRGAGGHRIETYGTPSGQGPGDPHWDSTRLSIEVWTRTCGGAHGSEEFALGGGGSGTSPWVCCPRLQAPIGRSPSAALPLDPFPPSAAVPIGLSPPRGLPLPPCPTLPSRLPFPFPWHFPSVGGGGRFRCRWPPWLQLLADHSEISGGAV